jgi:two-component system chemotaxis response regulator CheB
MDGLGFLERVMALRPMPVVMISSLSQAGADATFRAFELGAVDVIAKPTADLQHGLEQKREEIITKVKAAARARVRPRNAAAEPRSPVARPMGLGKGYASTEKLIAIGASTGGVEALTTVLTALPAACPAIVVTQHMPAQFTQKFADRLDGLCALRVKEATDGERLLPGHVYIAPGDRHLEVNRSGANYVARARSTERVSGHCPSVDVLFRSVAHAAGRDAIGVILTGMGRDGALGLGDLRQSGGHTLAQNEASCVVYGMPRAAVEAGAVETILSLEAIAGHLLQSFSREGGHAIRI